MRKTTNGFTVVELIIVIVIIGILAAIAIVAYSGAQSRAQNTSRLEELRSWQKSFIQYKADNDGLYPAMADGGYCLGTGFPSGKCRDYTQPVNVYTESASTGLMSALSTYDPPKGSPRVPVNGSVGPYVEYYSAVIHLTMVINGTSSDCPSPTFYVWDDGAGRVLCRIALQR